MDVTAARPGAAEGWVAYDTALRPLVWGASTYTVVELDERVVAAAAAAGTRRVAGFVEDVAVNVGIARADVVPWAFFYAGPALRRRLGVPLGEAVRVRLRPVDPDVVPVPDDVREALERAGRAATFDRRPAPERRRLLQPVDDAARPETRARRIAALVASLATD